MLFGERSDDGALPSHVPLPTDRDVRKRLTEIAERAGGGIRVETAGSSATGMLPREVPEHVSLEVRAFDRPLDRTWARTSYSGLTAGLHDHPGAGHGEVVSEPEVPGVVDEPVPGADEVEPGADGASAPDAPATRGVDEAHQQSPMAGLPAGAAFGTLVHGVLEEMDFASADLRGDLVTACQDAGSERFLGVRAADLADALLPSLLTPLGPLAGDRRLCDVAEVDRLDELNFELPLVGGDLATGVATLGQIADLLRDHLPEGDPLVAYPEDLASPLLAARQMRGFLAGSIDVVLRLSEQGGPSRYVVADYKTNWLGGEPTVTAWHYRPEAMTRAMRAAHYPLQALLYSVALHRFLRWRQPGYDPAVHLGGVLYLFLRGMCGPTTPIIDGTPCGVFSWSPSAALVTDLSDLLDSGGAR
jgi:exodeoxyribonuclease V beta subunit